MFAQHTWLMMWHALVVQLEYRLSKAPYLGELEVQAESPTSQ